ncbi:LOB domain-containing protein 22 [Actinidia rufa]|uniref:LOB domain-containing protein 22 n=1 Tax=Actinidia rufa TaxID=165716 RepID=A0A7J0H2H2_9ERIC|nr:LOB domain-containing protein 22 [Actinidia rufa]
MSNTNTKTNTNKNTSPSISAVAASTAGPGGVTTGSQACAACKYQRRKCAPDCILAPYFPPNEQKQFLNAHKLFGVSNIVKVLNHVKPLERETAMKSLIFHANVRAHDPVGGCSRIIRNLQHQIFESKTELAITLRQLALCRQTPNPSLVRPIVGLRSGESSSDGLRFVWEIGECESYSGTRAVL